MKIMNMTLNVSELIDSIARIIIGYLAMIYLGSLKLDFSTFYFSFNLIILSLIIISFPRKESLLIYFFYVITVFNNLSWGWINQTLFSSLTSIESLKVMGLVVPLVLSGLILKDKSISNIHFSTFKWILISWISYFIITSALIFVLNNTSLKFWEIFIKYFLQNILLYLSLGIGTHLLGTFMNRLIIKEINIKKDTVNTIDEEINDEIEL